MKGILVSPVKSQYLKMSFIVSLLYLTIVGYHKFAYVENGSLYFSHGVHCIIPCSIACRVKIILSTILPGVSNLRSTGTHYSYEEILDINEDIDDINKAIKKLAQSKNNVFVVEHPSLMIPLERFKIFCWLRMVYTSVLRVQGLPWKM